MSNRSLCPDRRGATAVESGLIAGLLAVIITGSLAHGPTSLHGGLAGALAQVFHVIGARL